MDKLRLVVTLGAYKLALDEAVHGYVEGAEVPFEDLVLQYGRRTGVTSDDVRHLLGMTFGAAAAELTSDPSATAAEAAAYLSRGSSGSSPG